MSEDLFRDFWWLIFPIFGMAMAVIGCLRDNSRDAAILRAARENLGAQIMSEELFHSYWWLIFPIFGMVLAVWGMIQSDRRADNAMRLLKSYAEQGKELPAELLRMAAGDGEDKSARPSSSRQSSGAWTFVVFAALAAGFGAGWYSVRGEDAAFAFLIVAVTMAVLAVGALLILIFGRK